MTGSFPAPLAAFALLAPLMAGCVADDSTGSTQAGNTQPRQAVYRCAEAGELDVRRVSGGVQIIDVEGESVTLPPAPPGQFTRFGADGYALVIEGRDALWMKAGSVPLDCQR